MTVHCAERRCGPAGEEVLREDGLEVQGVVEGLLRHPDRIVGLLGEDHVRPAVARAVPQLDLRLHRRRAVAVAVIGDDIHVHLRMRLGVQLRNRQADRVDPDGDRARRGVRDRRPGFQAARRRGSERSRCESGERYERKPLTVDLHEAPPLECRVAACGASLHREVHLLARPYSLDAPTDVERCSCTKSGSATPGSVGAWTRPSGPTRDSRATGLDVTSDS